MVGDKKKKFSLGVDYGTNSVRALVADVSDGSEIAASVHNYESGDQGILLDRKDANLARQNPADYIRGFFASVSGAVNKAKKVRGFDPKNVVGIGIDTTGSTPLPVNKNGIPLALHPEFKRDLSAQA